jgi:hypothetical protein
MEIVCVNNPITYRIPYYVMVWHNTLRLSTLMEMLQKIFTG